MLSVIVRRDLQDPIKYFRHFEVWHYYLWTSYNDMASEEFQNLRLKKFPGIFRFLCEVKKLSPVIIQGNELLTFPWGFTMCIAAYLAQTLYKIPYFFNMLDNRPPEKKFGSVLSLIPKFLLKEYARTARFIIYLNKGARKTLRALKVPNKKLFFLHWGNWGIDTDEFKPGIVQKHPKILLFVGTLEQRKGVADLLRAFELIAQKQSEVVLHIVGDGPLRKELEQYAKKKCLDSVTFFGTIKNRDLPSFFQKAFLTITPSITTQRWEEQIGNVNLQSMSCGVPVVSTKSGAIPEYVEDGKVGILVSEHNPNEIANAVLSLLDNPLKWDILSQNARKTVLEKYNAKKNIEDIELFLIKNLSDR